MLFEDEEEKKMSTWDYIKVSAKVAGIVAVVSVVGGLGLLVKNAVENKKPKTQYTQKSEKLLEIGGKDIDAAVGNYGVCTYNGMAMIIAAGSSLTGKIDSSYTFIIAPVDSDDASGAAFASVRSIKQGKETVYNSDEVFTPRQPVEKGYTAESIDDLVKKSKHENQSVSLSEVKVEQTDTGDYELFTSASKSNKKIQVGNIDNINELLLKYAINHNIPIKEITGTIKNGMLDVDMLSLGYE